ncbi:MAG: DUF6132 family protein [Calditrichia bacterium]
MKSKILVKILVFTFIGAVAGFGYYYFIGCRTGACPLSSNPYLMSGYGALFGLVLGFDIRLFRRTEDESKV